MVQLADYRGARGSNARDEFHELWALEQVLGLLAPNTQLRAIKVEGVRTGRSGADTNEPFWNSVDCSLYFGGDTLETADAVEFVQLKYSGEPSRAWSVGTPHGQFRQNRKQLRPAEACRRLPQPAAAHETRGGPQAPVCQQSGLCTGGQRSCRGWSQRRSIPAAVAKDLACIGKATGLRGQDRIGFLASLDLSGCAAARGFVAANASSAESRSLSRTTPRTLCRS